MASFKDAKSREWNLKLTGPLADEIEEKHKIDLTNLEADPLIKIRNNPRKLVAIVYLFCQRQIKELQIDVVEFAESLPSPPDPMLIALTDAVIDFFPGGRASHVREVLTEYEKTAVMGDEIMLTKMKTINSDPKLRKRMEARGDREFEKLINGEFPTVEVE